MAKKKRTFLGSVLNTIKNEAVGLGGNVIDMADPLNLGYGDSFKNDFMDTMGVDKKDSFMAKFGDVQDSFLQGVTNVVPGTKKLQEYTDKKFNPSSYETNPLTGEVYKKEQWKGQNKWEKSSQGVGQIAGSIALMAATAGAFAPATAASTTASAGTTAAGTAEGLAAVGGSGALTAEGTAAGLGTAGNLATTGGTVASTAEGVASTGNTINNTASNTSTLTNAGKQLLGLNNPVQTGIKGITQGGGEIANAATGAYDPFDMQGYLKQQQEFQQQQQKLQLEQSLLERYQIEQENKNPMYNMNTNQYAFYGAYGGIRPNQLITYKGARHEQGGIPLGNNQEVEGNETNWKEYIFSDRKDMKIPGSKQTFANKSKLIQNKYKGRELDDLASAALDKEMNALMAVQEQIRATKAQKYLNKVEEYLNTEAFCKGGKRRYANGGDLTLETIADRTITPSPYLQDNVIIPYISGYESGTNPAGNIFNKPIYKGIQITQGGQNVIPINVSPGEYRNLSKKTEYNMNVLSGYPEETQKLTDKLSLGKVSTLHKLQPKGKRKMANGGPVNPPPQYDLKGAFQQLGLPEDFLDKITYSSTTNPVDLLDKALMANPNFGYNNVPMFADPQQFADFAHAVNEQLINKYKALGLSPTDLDRVLLIDPVAMNYLPKGSNIPAASGEGNATVEQGFYAPRSITYSGYVKGYPQIFQNNTNKTSGNKVVTIKGNQQIPPKVVRGIPVKLDSSGKGTSYYNALLDANGNVVGLNETDINFFEKTPKTNKASQKQQEQVIERLRERGKMAGGGWLAVKPGTMGFNEFPTDRILPDSAYTQPNYLGLVGSGISTLGLLPEVFSKKKKYTPDYINLPDVNLKGNVNLVDYGASLQNLQQQAGLAQQMSGANARRFANNAGQMMSMRQQGMAPIMSALGQQYSQVQQDQANTNAQIMNQTMMQEQMINNQNKIKQLIYNNQLKQQADTANEMEKIRKRQAIAALAQSVGNAVTGFSKDVNMANAINTQNYLAGLNINAMNPNYRLQQGLVGHNTTPENTFLSNINPMNSNYTTNSRLFRYKNPNGFIGPYAPNYYE